MIASVICCNSIVSQLQDAAARGVKLAVFPEFCLTGYTCGDLFLQRTLQQGALDALQTLSLIHI